MTYLIAEHDAEDTISDSMGATYDEDVTARISNPAAENGEPTRGPLSWLNSARVTADIEDDAVYCVVSFDDPRGGLCMTVRRLPDGRIVISTPRAGIGRMQHCDLAEYGDGLVVVDSKGEPRTFEDDPEPWVDEISRWPRERCAEALESVGIDCDDEEPVDELREAVAENLRDGTIDPEDWNLPNED